MDYFSTLPKSKPIYGGSDYFSLLPPDLLRQTALSLSPEDIFKLSLDPTFKNILNNKFWQDKLEADFQYFSKCLPGIGLWQIEEKAYNKYLYKYYLCLKNDPDNYMYKRNYGLNWYNIYKTEYDELLESMDFPPILQLEIAVRNKLIEERGPNWPQVYFVDSIEEIKNPKDYDMCVIDGKEYIVRDNVVTYIYNMGRNFDLFQPLFERLNYNNKNYSDRKQAIRQIYLLE